MRREKTAWLISIVLIAILAFQLPGTLAQRDDDYAFVRTLVDIHRQVLQNYADPPQEDQLREAAINGMLNELDPFSVYIPPSKQDDFDRMLEGSFKGVGIRLDQKGDVGAIEVVTPIDGSPAFKAGVMPGDIILKVNGESIEGMRVSEVIEKIAGPLGSEVGLTVRHVDGREEELTMTRQEIVVPTVIGYQRASDNTWDYYASTDPKIAYIRITQFTNETHDALRAVLERLLEDGMKGLILDMRFNPGGRLDQAIQVVDMFIDSGVIVSTKGRNRPEQVARATVPDTLPEFPMIVLVNEGSASAAEIVAGSLMDNRRALVLGEQSYGKGSVQELIPLDGKGGELKLTVAYYYLPSGRLVHRKKEMKDGDDYGVKPQILVPMSLDQEKAAMMQRWEHELVKVPNGSTQPTTASATQPATQPADPQLQRAIDTMIALVVLQSDKAAGAGDPATRPATAPREPAEPPATQEQKLDPRKVVPDAPAGAQPTTAPKEQKLDPKRVLPDIPE
jgi:carboxyl-terminal processing protease